MCVVVCGMCVDMVLVYVILPGCAVCGDVGRCGSGAYNTLLLQGCVVLCAVCGDVQTSFRCL